MTSAKKHSQEIQSVTQANLVCRALYSQWMSIKAKDLAGKQDGTLALRPAFAASYING